MCATMSSVGFAANAASGTVSTVGASLARGTDAVSNLIATGVAVEGLSV